MIINDNLQLGTSSFRVFLNTLKIWQQTTVSKEEKRKQSEPSKVKMYIERSRPHLKDLFMEIKIEGR